MFTSEDRFCAGPEDPLPEELAKLDPQLIEQVTSTEAPPAH